jgi:hypothetical protein
MVNGLSAKTDYCLTGEGTSGWLTNMDYDNTFTFSGDSFQEIG